MSETPIYDAYMASPKRPADFIRAVKALRQKNGIGLTHNSTHYGDGPEYGVMDGASETEAIRVSEMGRPEVHPFKKYPIIEEDTVNNIDPAPEGVPVDYTPMPRARSYNYSDPADVKAAQTEFMKEHQRYLDALKKAADEANRIAVIRKAKGKLGEKLGPIYEKRAAIAKREGELATLYGPTSEREAELAGLFGKSRRRKTRGKPRRSKKTRRARKH